MGQRDLTGQKFGRWTAIERTKIYSGKWRTAWKCVCDCGTERTISQDNLVGGRSLSCGCLMREVNADLRSKHFDLVGQKFGKWTVLEKTEMFLGDGHRKYQAWLCRCECGTERTVLQDALLNGASKSCGCRMSEVSVQIHATHDESNTRLYDIWSGMKARCYNHAVDSYENYGGRGIGVCDEWLNDYTAFSNWAHSNGYSDDLTLDRIDVDGDYCQDNCRWANRITQCNNKRNNLRIDWHGETHTLAEWCRILHLPYKKTHARYRYYGWDIDDIFTTA